MMEESRQAAGGGGLYMSGQSTPLHFDIENDDDDVDIMDQSLVDAVREASKDGRLNAFANHVFENADVSGGAENGNHGNGVDGNNSGSERSESLKRKRCDERTPAADTTKNNNNGYQFVPSVSRRKKKPKGMPKRPLSAYNLFFQEERVRLMEQVGTKLDPQQQGGSSPGKFARIGFEELAKTIGKRWKALSDEERKKYNELADEDSVRYRTEMKIYNQSSRKKAEKKIVSESSKVPPSPQKREEASRSPSGLDIISVNSSSFRPVSNRESNEQASQPAPPGSYQRTASYQSSAPQAGSQQQQQQQQAGQNQAFFAEAAPVSAWSVPNAHAVPLGSGMEIYMPDPDTGRERKYVVSYTIYSLKNRAAAEEYMKSLLAARHTPSQTEQPGSPRLHMSPPQPPPPLPQPPAHVHVYLPGQALLQQQQQPQPQQVIASPPSPQQHHHQQQQQLHAQQQQQQHHHHQQQQQHAAVQQHQQEQNHQHTGVPRCYLPVYWK